MFFSKPLLTAASLLACAGVLAQTRDADVDGCDPLVPQYCMLPFPNDFWRVQDTQSGGYHLNFTANVFPVDDHGKTIDPAAGGWNSLKGFSTFPAITTYFPHMGESSLEHCARWWDIASSEDLAKSPTVLLDAETLKPVPHWVELDYSSHKVDNVDNKHALMIWPATALDYNRRYIVAVRGLKEESGDAISPSKAFQHLLDASPRTVREKHFSEIFESLESVGVARIDLLIAWDFTTNDKEDVTGRLVHVRDDAKQRIGEDGPEYVIDSIEYDTDELVAKKIKGKFQMPTYLNTPYPTHTARLVLDETGAPVYQSDEWYRFEVIVPKAFAESEKSAGILQYGHGLFGSYDEVGYSSSGYLWQDATDFGYVLAASTWIGLAGQDVPAAIRILGDDLTDFAYIPDRTVQGVVNALGLMTMMKGRFSRDPVMQTSDGKPILDTSKTAYTGNSEGGILGAVYMAATQEVKRGVLGVPGGPYSMLLPRSLDFGLEFDMLKLRYMDPVDRINLMQVMQMLWDRAEPSGFMRAINQQLLPDTPSHEVLFQYGLGDAQVSWLAAQSAARSTNSVMYASNAKEHDEEFFGFEMLEDDQAVTGRSGIQGFDFMSPQAPVQNVPPVSEGDTHEDVRRDPNARAQLGNFLLTGEITNTCGGTCISEPTLKFPKIPLIPKELKSHD
mmetsp:Transcript_6422/g.10514  ORF Transcript_6422/g.10514 Transcript_6422/m.10514 type:complete len:673 (-) Transcript_6422:142-2160(-)